MDVDTRTGEITEEPTEFFNRVSNTEDPQPKGRSRLQLELTELSRVCAHGIPAGSMYRLLTEGVVLRIFDDRSKTHKCFKVGSNLAKRMRAAYPVSWVERLTVLIHGQLGAPQYAVTARTQELQRVLEEATRDDNFVPYAERPIAMKCRDSRALGQMLDRVLEEARQSNGKALQKRQATKISWLVRYLLDCCETVGRKVVKRSLRQIAEDSAGLFNDPMAVWRAVGWINAGNLNCILPMWHVKVGRIGRVGNESSTFRLNNGYSYLLGSLKAVQCA